MRPQAPDSAYLWDMLEISRTVRSILLGVTLDEFMQDRVRQLSVERGLEIIGEAARRISVGFKHAHGEIPWRDIIGLRNILAHEYAEVDLELVWETVTRDIPKLIELLEELVPLPPAPEETQ